mmetsp:Transcript_1960/g.3423  ORF Transcript_1960/g.3423 Transcript_1960/m.3423 type:complete len:137 (+) Transcript_1960:518-928(+)
MSEDEALDKILINETEIGMELKDFDDINNFVQDNLNKKLPLDGPLMRIYSQPFIIDGKAGSIMILISHHSFCDGLSGMSFSLSLSEKYDPSYFIKVKGATSLQKVLIRLLVPLQIPILLFQIIPSNLKPNFITKKN